MAQWTYYFGGKVFAPGGPLETSDRQEVVAGGREKNVLELVFAGQSGLGHSLLERNMHVSLHS